MIFSVEDSLGPNLQPSGSDHPIQLIYVFAGQAAHRASLEGWQVTANSKRVPKAWRSTKSRQAAVQCANEPQLVFGRELGGQLRNAFKTDRGATHIHARCWKPSLFRSSFVRAL